MTTWILIAHLSASYGGGPVAVEFASETACLSAVGAMTKAADASGKSVDFAICVPKGVPE